jgi:hypothetical protein
VPGPDFGDTYLVNRLILWELVAFPSCIPGSCRATFPLQIRCLFKGHPMKVTFVEVDRETLYLLPPSIQDWLPEKHPARFVVEIVEQLDLQPLKASYCGRGSKPYNPETLVALLFYGYATGVFSSRKLERSTYDSVAFRPFTPQLKRTGPVQQFSRKSDRNYGWFQFPVRQPPRERLPIEV